jgi:primosomal protein N' (replication factor Y)
MTELYCDLAIPGAVDKLFTYSVPPELQSAVRRGVRVIASFGSRTVIGFIVETSAHSQACAERGRSVPHIKPIQDILDTEPVLSDDILDLTQWLAEYYFAPWGEVLKSVLVQGSARPGKRIAELTGSDPAAVFHALAHAPKQTALVRELLHGPRTVQDLQKTTHTKTINNAVNDLVRRGFVRIIDELPGATARPKTENYIDITYDVRSQWEAALTDGTLSARRASGQVAILRELVGTISLPSTISTAELLRTSGGTPSALQALVRKGIVTVSAREVSRQPEMEVYPSSLGSIDITLNETQENAFAQVRQAIDDRRFKTFLLHGVTGSGKTQVYIESIRAALATGKTAIVLVPEIALTPQIVRRFKYHFGETVAVIHSRMSVGERYDAWHAAWEGRCSVVIGPRSAIFAPLKNLGIIVVDEEHEASYKQFDQTPRYHARDVAIVRAANAGAVVLLGSATPSLESYTNAVNGKYTLLELPTRVDGATMPVIEIVDMTEERKLHKERMRAKRRAAKEAGVESAPPPKTMEWYSLSQLLRTKIEERLERKEGTILLQNRRGFAPFVECPDCGAVELCVNCNISLTYHSAASHLRCHYCGLTKQPPTQCPKCGSADIHMRGVGTQRVEQELASLYPAARVLRMDLDTTTRKGSHDRLLREFSDGGADILLGTQMVAKGLDFSRVTLVGVVSADTQMLLPDFRSSERTFQLLTQVAGRAGRSVLAGEVVIQTYQPAHPTLRYVISHDFAGFYAEETASRKELSYPPFARLILLEFRGKHENDVIQHAMQFADGFTGLREGLTLLGPASAALSRLKGMYRWHIIIKSAKENDPGGHLLHRAVQNALHAYRSSSAGKSRAVRIIVDTDPAGMM